MDNDIYMKIPDIFKLPEVNNTKSRGMCSIKLQKISIWIDVIWMHVVQSC